jgi:hypothetical protein
MKNFGKKSSAWVRSSSWVGVYGEEKKKDRLQHESFAYGLPLHYSVSLLAA